MPEIVEDGSGLINANTYVSSSTANAYILLMPAQDQAAWTTKTAGQREVLLQFSTRVLDQLATWNGTPTNPDTQALRWPRMGTTDCDGRRVADNVVPKPVSDATIELAAFYARAGNSPIAIAPTKGLMSAQIDVLAFQWLEGFDPNVQLRLPAGLNRILCGLGTIASGNRKQFAPIRKY